MHHDAHGPEGYDHTAERGAVLTDPVCGMTVDPAKTEHRLELDGETFYFCSAGCRSKLEADPEHYRRATPGAERTQTTATAGTDFTCPMHPEVREDGPGSCPKCGMALEPLTPAVAATRVEYTCPMHPEVVREEPGSCPICGMALEPRTVTLAEEENPELKDMTRRFFVATALSVPLLGVAMGDMLPGEPVSHLLSGRCRTPDYPVSPFPQSSAEFF